MSYDPVCHMNVNPKVSNYIAEYKGNTYYFCSEGCMKAFNTIPEQYLNRNTAPTAGHYHGAMGGCCGMGAGAGWMRYLYIGFLLLYLASRFLR